MSKTRSIDPQTARDKVRSREAILVCAYDDEDKCRELRLDGALTLTQFLHTLDDRDRRDEIIFYCA